LAELQVLTHEFYGPIRDWPRLASDSILSFAPLVFPSKLLEHQEGNHASAVHVTPLDPPDSLMQTVHKLAFSPIGNCVVVSDRVVTLLWNLDTSTPPKQLNQLNGPSDIINAIAFSPDGRLVASGTDDTTARVWDVKTGKELPCSPLAGHSDSVITLAFSPDSKYIVTGSYDWTVCIWPVESNTKDHLYNSDTKEYLYQFNGHSGMVSDVKYSPDGKLVASAAHDATVRIWDSSDGATMAVIPDTGWINSVASRREISGRWFD